jgi:hypothetical protein
MKHLKLLLVLSIISLFAVWSMATVEIQTTTPRVNPNGSSEIVGTFRMVFSAPEFGDPNDTANTTYYVLVRVQLSQGVRLVNIGGLTKPEITPVNFVQIAMEKDAGNPTFPQLDPNAVRLIRFESGTAYDYFDLLFTKNMYTADWGLSISDRVRITLGTPDGVTPSDATNNFGGGPGVGMQHDTRLCCNFAATTADFQYDDFWRVGMVAFHSDINGALGATYSVNFQPSDPSLAQKGQPAELCEINAYWPEKGDDCNPQACNQGPAIGDDCPTPPIVDQQTPPPCDDSWNNYIGEAEFGSCHWFAITEWCPTSGHWVFQPGGEIDITLNPTDNPDLSVEFCSMPNVMIFGDSLAAPYTVVNGAFGAEITYTPSTIHIVLPDDVWYSPTHSQPYCILVDLGSICYETCPLLDLPADQTVSVTIDIDYTPPNFVCGVKPAPIQDFKVADIYGCEPVEPPAEDYYLVLYFPFLAPVNNTEVNWWCGVAVSNYADEATNEGIFFMWEEDGDEYYVEVDPLGGHEMWLRNLTDLTFERSPGNTDTTPADEAMSGVLFMRVTTPEYWRNYQSTSLLSGALAGIDAFVLMGDGTQAYGYVARHIDSFSEFLFDPFTGRAPIWSKGHK